MQSFCDAVTDAARAIDPKYLKEGEQVLVGFEGPFVSRRVTPRDLLSEFIGSMVCVEGIITKCKIKYTSPFTLFFIFPFYLSIICMIQRLLVFHDVKFYKKWFFIARILLELVCMIKRSFIQLLLDEV